MESSKIDNNGTGRIFENQTLESLSRTHPLVIYSIYFPAIIGMLYYGWKYKHLGMGYEGLLFITGILLWSLFEYLMHRYLFHITTETSRGKRLVYIMHGIHHKYPRDKTRLFMPVIPSVILATVIFLIMFLIIRWNCLAVFPGFLFGYLLYGSMHYAIHAFRPPKYLKALWRNHSLHHYQTPDKGFGVSSVLWDVVFRTVPDKQNAVPDNNKPIS